MGEQGENLIKPSVHPR